MLKTTLFTSQPKLSYRILLVIPLLFTAAMPAIGASLIEVSLNSPQDVELLLGRGFDLVYMPDSLSAIITLYDTDEQLRLDRIELTYNVIHENLEEYYVSRLQPGRDDMGGYRTYDEIVAELGDLHDDFPDIISEPISIGRSIEGRDIWAIMISDNAGENEDEPEVMYTALIHANEVITAEVLFGVIYHLVENYEDDEFVTHLVNDRQMWFLPCLNPDAYVFMERQNPDGGGAWRKNRRVNIDGSIGVDLNRNFGYMWGFDDRGSSPQGNNHRYRGLAPFSEPETQAVRDFVNDRQISISIFFHSFSNLCMYPFGYDQIFPPDPDRAVFTALVNHLTAVNNYRPQPFWRMYLSNGISEDWLYASEDHNTIFAFTMEVGSLRDGHWPPRESVDRLVSENIDACLTAAEYCNEPRRTLPPPTPVNVTAISHRQGHPIIDWDVPEDLVNPAVGFRIMANLPEEEGEVIVEGIEEPPWVDNEHGVDDGFEYRVQSVDAEEDTSSWSEPAMVEIPIDTIFVILREDWSMISINVLPNEDFYREDDDRGPDIELITEQIVDNLILLKNEHGQFYLPEYNFNNLPYWDSHRGYLIKMTEADTLIINGEQIPADEPIALREGWNIIAYFPEEELEAPEAFQNIEDVLLLVKDGEGHFYLPERNFNNMEPLSRGSGYMVKVREEVEFIWNE